MSVRQLATGPDGTAYEVRERWLGFKADGKAYRIKTDDGSEPTMKDCRRAAEDYATKMLANGTVVFLAWTTYPWSE